MKVNLKPTQHPRVMDLVHEAGIDVSDWSNGDNNAASNPNYCYEWSYVNNNNKTIVLNIWHSGIEFIDNNYIYNFNPRLTADSEKGVRKKRAYNVDFALQKAVREKLPVRVIICDNDREDNVVDRRLLDDEHWSVAKYDNTNGSCTLSRGISELQYIDQFDDDELKSEIHNTHESTSITYERSSQIRRSVLLRAKGYCELCGEKGFMTKSGAIYLESHHIISLSNNGADSINNVIALCPNHHREAHYGQNTEAQKIEFFEIIKKNNLQKS